MDNIKLDSLTVEAGIDWYIDQLVSKKDAFEGLDEDALMEVKSDLKERVEAYVNTTILKYVPENKIEELEKILDTNNQEEIHKFFQQNVSNLNEVVALALANFKKSYLES